MALRITTTTLHVYTSTLRIDTYYLRFGERYKNSRNTSIIHINYDNLPLFNQIAHAGDDRTVKKLDLRGQPYPASNPSARLTPSSPRSWDIW